MTRDSMPDGGVKARRGDLLLIPFVHSATASFSAAASGVARSSRWASYGFAVVSGVSRAGVVIRHVRHHTAAAGGVYTRESKGDIVGGMIAPQERFAPHSADAVMAILADQEWESVDAARAALLAAVARLVAEAAAPARMACGCCENRFDAVPAADSFCPHCGSYEVERAGVHNAFLATQKDGAAYVRG